MSLPWSAQQMEWLREMGFDVLTRRVGAAPGEASPSPITHITPATDADADADAAAGGRIPACLARAARGVDIAPLLAGGLPCDVAGRRRLWRALRPLRKAARSR